MLSNITLTEVASLPNVHEVRQQLVAQRNYEVRIADAAAIAYTQYVMKRVNDCAAAYDVRNQLFPNA
jgi:hypothetical protein